MEAAAGAVTRRGAFCPAATAALLRRDARAAGWTGCSRVCVRPPGRFADDGHLRYYASPARCGGRREEKEEKGVMKKRAKLVKGLAALQAVAGGLGVAVAPGETEDRRMALTEAADVLLARLELLRAEEKEMKRKMKEEKKAAKKAAAKRMKACDESEDSDSEDERKEINSDNKMEEKDSLRCKGTNHKETKMMEEEEKVGRKAAGRQMKDCDQSEDSSSSSSSESSDSDCEEVMDMSSLRTVTADAEPAIGEVQMETPKDELNLPIIAGRTEEGAKVASAFKCGLECSTGIASVVGSNTNTCCSSSIVADAGSNTSTCCSSSKSSSPVVMAAEAVAPAERIEVCMGGKCKKSGAIELMQEFERRVGIEGAVVSCKCMGKCREGPNVRVRNVYNEGDESVMAVRNPLCIGVGLDDVGTIVANFFGEKGLGLLAA